MDPLPEGNPVARPLGGGDMASLSAGQEYGSNNPIDLLEELVSANEWRFDRTTDAEILLARFREEDVLAGKFCSPQSRGGIVVNKALARQKGAQ